MAIKLVPYDEYAKYLVFIRENPELGLPVPRSWLDYSEHRDEWAALYSEPEPTPSPEPPSPTPPSPAPPVPPEPEERERTDDEIREYQAYRRYASTYGDPDDWYPLSIDDYFANWDIAQEQLDEWKEEVTQAEQREIEYEKEQQEADRRREEAYQKSQYAQQEAYHEQPEYGQQYEKWLGAQRDKSLPIQHFMERMFPSYREQFEATQPRPTGYATREEARTEAARRETEFQNWTNRKLPEMEAEFWEQSPYQREERPSIFAPRLRSVSY